jgi:hypothetical protein
MKTSFTRSPRRPSWPFALAALAAAPLAAFAQYTTPHITTAAGAEPSKLGDTTFVNHGLVGVGRISASALDSFGESFGSVSSLQITNWRRVTGHTYAGTFNILPDRGFNAGNFYSLYPARIQKVDFSFTPYSGSASIGGADLAAKLAAQNQIVFTSAISGAKFTYFDPTSNAFSPTTGLDPAAGTKLIFGLTMPYVLSYTGAATPDATSDTTYNNVNMLPIDAEGLVLKADGSGYLSDEYGPNIYYFNANQQIVGAIVPPEAMRPHSPVGTLNFNSTTSPVNGRRENQGMEGVALSPSGTRLFALLQSSTIQDSAGKDQTTANTRLLVYDVSTATTPSAPIAEYALTLPTYRSKGDGKAVNKTAAQSEIVAIDDTHILVLSRDGNGLGNDSANPCVFKSILLVDTTTGSPTNFAGTARDDEGGVITSTPGTLDPAITPLSWVEAVNMLNSTQLAKFNFVIDNGADQVSKLTLSEKWEGMSLVSAEDSDAPNDYFLFVGNDNDFLTSAGKIVAPDGTLVSYNAFDGFPASRIPAAVGDANDPTANENDTVFLVYRVTIASGDDATETPKSHDHREPPVVQLPGKGKRVTSDDQITLRGRVSDPDSNVRVVQVKVNSGKFRKAKGAAKWQFNASLKPGRNVIIVRSIDADGHVSKTKKIVVIRK